MMRVSKKSLYERICLAQSHKKKSPLKPSHILLDSQSNMDILNHEQLVLNVREVVGVGMELQSNGGGSLKTRRKGFVKGYGYVWFDERSKANINNLSNMIRKHFNVWLNTGPSDTVPAMYLERKDGTILAFKEYDNGLYIYDAVRMEGLREDWLAGKNTNDLTKTTCYDAHQISLLQKKLGTQQSTITDCQKIFTPQQVKMAHKARQLYIDYG